MKVLLVLLIIFGSSPVSALTCRNDYGGSTSCAGNSSAAGDCQTLGYSQAGVTNCEHYLYCPFDPSYRRCVALQTQEPEGVCTTGSFNPVCETGFAPYKVGETTDLKMCLECQPATCSAYNSSYKSKDEYFAQETFPIYATKSIELVSSPTEKTHQTCYYPCNNTIVLKPITSANCNIGDILVWIRGDNKSYCTSSTSTSASPCETFERLGVIAYKSGSKIWAVKTVGMIALSAVNTWPAGKNCQNLYQSSKKNDDYSYNTQVLLGRVSSSFASNGCSLYGGLIGGMYFNSAAKTFFYGFPNAEILGNIAKNLSVVNRSLSAIGWDEMQTAYACSGKVIWFDDGFSINYSGSSSGYDYVYAYTGTISQGQFARCTPPVSVNSAKGFGVMVLDASTLAN